MTTRPYTVAYLTPEQADEVVAILQARLTVLNELHLLLKHAHWNVTGPGFIAVHEMIDPQVDEVRAMADTVAERIATLGGTPNGIAAAATINYTVGRAPVAEHLAALDATYDKVTQDHYAAAEATAGVDDVTNGVLLTQIEALDLFHWFVRSHLG
jgi:starvation-inducible DNA-binding protein